MSRRHIWKVNYKCNHATTVTIAAWSPPSDHKTVSGETETNNPLHTTQYSVPASRAMQISEISNFLLIIILATRRPAAHYKLMANLGKTFMGYEINIHEFSHHQILRQCVDNFIGKYQISIVWRKIYRNINLISMFHLQNWMLVVKWKERV